MKQKDKEQNIEKTTASAQAIFDAPDIGLSRTDIALRIIGFFAARAMPYPMGAPFGISFLSSERRFGIGAIIGCAATALGYASLFDIRLAAKYICCSFAYLLFLFVTDNRGRDLSSAVAIGAASAISLLGGTVELIVDGVSLGLVAKIICDCIITAIGGVIFEKSSYILNGRRRALFSMNTEERLCLAATGIIVILGFKGIRLLNFVSAANILCLWTVSVFACAGGSCIAAVCGICVGAVSGLGGDILYAIAVFAICGLFGGVARGYGKYAVALVVSAIAAAGAAYCAANGTSLFCYADIPLAAGLAAIMPESSFGTLRRILGIHSCAADNMRCRDYIHDRLGTAASSFRNLAQTLFSLSEPSGTEDIENASVLFDSVADRVCRKCSVIGDCWVKNYDGTYKGLCKMLEVMRNKGNVSENEVEDCFNRRCLHVRNMAREMNSLYEIYRINNVWKDKLNENRELAAQQLGSVAQILDEISDEVYEDKIDGNAEEEIRMRLASKGFDITELDVTIGAKQRYFAYIGAVVGDNADSFRRCAETALRIILGVKMVMIGAVRGEDDELIMRFTQPEGYMIESGMASDCFSEENGDSSVTRYLSEGKFAAALSDGMGTGHRASRDSTATVRLLGDFLEAGFDRTVAVRLVNSIMVMKSADEAFATIDMCVVDLYSGETEFIKNGAEPSYIKRGSDVETIRSTTLPVGVACDMKVETFAHHLAPGDIVVMVSDGIASKTDGDWIMESIEKSDPEMPAQELADRLLDRANSVVETDAADDMTVIVLKLYARR